MCEVKYKIVTENGQTHYKVWNEYREESCDLGELHETVKEMEQDEREVLS